MSQFLDEVGSRGLGRGELVSFGCLGTRGRPRGEGRPERGRRLDEKGRVREEGFGKDFGEESSDDFLVDLDDRRLFVVRLKEVKRGSESQLRVHGKEAKRGRRTFAGSPVEDW